MRELTIRTKIIIVFGIYFSVLFSIIGYFATRDVIEKSYKIFNNNLNNYNVLLIQEINNQISTKTFFDQKSLLMVKSDGLTSVKIQLFDSIYCPIIKNSYINKNKLTEFGLSLSNYITGEFQEFKIDNFNYKGKLSKIKIAKKSYYLFVAASTSDIVLHHYEHILFFLVIIPLSIILTLIFTYYILKSGYKPIINTINTLESITLKNISNRISVPEAKDEIKLLVITLNNMLERLENSVLSQKRFIADASHEIRTPLAIIQSELEYINKTKKLENIRESINISLEEVERLNKLATSLLQLARLESGQNSQNYTDIDINELIIESVNILQNRFSEKEINFNCNLEPLKPFKCEKQELLSVFVNIIENAIKYSLNEPEIQIETEIQSNNINIKIADKGFGIKENDIQKIFSRFYRSDDIRGKIAGSGLGLSITKEIVEKYAGKIIIESKLGYGTSVVITLPSMLEK